jgi:exodeoxyribonuclease-3
MRKGFAKWMAKEGADVVCLQEIKISADDIKKGSYDLPRYQEYFFPARRPGYSGVAIYSKIKPDEVIYGLGIEEFDIEGRALALVFGKLKVYCLYFPNGKSGQKRLDYKMSFYRQFLKQIIKDSKSGFEVIFCGDVNTAHKEIDLARPKENTKMSGFLPQERAWIDEVVASGFEDVFREFDKSPQKYTWWSHYSNARKRNVGWRIDYIFASKGILNKIIEAKIRPEVLGSDHCPVSIIVGQFLGAGQGKKKGYTVKIR